MFSKQEESYIRPKTLKGKIERRFFPEKTRLAEEERRKEVLVKRNELQKNLETHDFSYDSGERQVATELADIREDHRMRYDWAVERIVHNLGTDSLVGGDYFCGNGYGTFILSDLGTVTGIDGSKEAIDVATKHYSAKGAHFSCDLFPFTLAKDSHDFIVTLESVEHIADDVAFLTELAQAVKPGGVLILSTPNEIHYPFDPTVVFHHVKHYYINDIMALVTGLGFELDAMIGQNFKSGTDDYEFCEAEDGRFVVFSFRKGS